MPLVHKSIRIDLPNQLPFDRDTDLEAFAGEYILPIEKKLKRFWFTRYGVVGQRYILFRFSTTKFEKIEAHINNITNIFGGAGCEDYDYVGDLANQRFLGTDARTKDKKKRADLVFAFLTASAKLLLASIVRDADGHWRHENERVSGYNNHTSLESVHHLFCNMTGVPTYAVLFSPTNAEQFVRSDMYSRDFIRANPQLPYKPFRIAH